MRTSSLVLLAPAPLLLALACGGDDSQAQPPPQPTVTATQPPLPPPPPPTQTASAVPPPPPAEPVELVAGTPAEAPAKMPSIKFVAPKNDEVIPAAKLDKAMVNLELKDWDTSKGAHVHVIIDNQPYFRLDDASKPFKLVDALGSYKLETGQHVLVAFPSRPTHESVKPQGKALPLALTTFWVDRKAKQTWKPGTPMVIFSRPKGMNANPNLPAEGMLVDFYLSHVELGSKKGSLDLLLKGPGVEDGKTVTLDEWKPWRLKHPRTGKYSLELTLKDKDGKPVPGAWTHVVREFEVDAAPVKGVTPADPHAGH